MADGASSTTSVPTGSASHLPWHLIPQFIPGETDLQEYSKRLEFLAGLWPSDHLDQLAPRAALQCTGSAFQKVLRILPDKLKVKSTAGVRLIVETLGGVWGKTTLESKYEKFEKAIFGLSQKPDESNESYIARHEVIYEELVSQNVTFSDVRAYLLLRHSTLSADDKKRVVIESQGDLKYDAVVTAIKMLGAKFFHDVQGQQKQYKSKTYDVNLVQDNEEEPAASEEHPTFAMTETGDLSEAMVEQFLAEGDEDALVVQQFEEALIDTVQGDEEMTAFLSTYVEARQKLTEKSKSRGFWPVRGPGGGKGGGRKGKSKFHGRRRKPLAARIAESTCRICYQPGHWKAECPRRGQSQTPGNMNPKPQTTQVANVMMPAHDDDDEDADVFVLETVCEDQDQGYVSPSQDTLEHVVFTCVASSQKKIVYQGALYHQVKSRLKELIKPLHSHHANRIARSEVGGHETPSDMPQKGNAVFCNARPSPTGDVTSNACPRRTVDVWKNPQKSQTEELINFATSNAVGILDLGASQSVMGEHQLEDFLQCLPVQVRSKVFEQPVQMAFRFGNNSIVQCDKAVFVPIDRFWIKIAIVPSKTPFLISNNVCRSLGAVIDTADQHIMFKKLSCSMPLTLSSKKLFLLDLSALIEMKPPILPETVGKLKVENVLACHESERKSDLHVEDHRHKGTGINHDTAISIHSKDSQKSHTLQCPTQSSAPSDLPTKSRENTESSGHVDVQPCPPIRSFADPRQGDQGPGSLQGHEPGAAEESEDPIRNSQAGSEVHGSCPSRSQVLPVVPQDMVEQHKVRAPRVPALSATLDREERTRARDHSIEPNHRDSPGQSQGQSSESNSHRPGGRGRRGRSVGCTRQSQSRERGQCSAPDDVGKHDVRGSDPAASHFQPAALGQQSTMSPSEQLMLDRAIQEINSVLDTGKYPTHTNHTNNWIYDEMTQYMKSRKQSHNTVRSHIDVLEVYCSANSQLTHQNIQLGRRAIRFGLKEGDLSYYEGRCKLYDIIMKFNPRDIWMSPKCKAWCKWNQFNAARSLSGAERVMTARQADSVHLLLCEALFRFQVSQGPQFHAHLEQPIGSDMLYQPELQVMLDNTLRTRCDQCAAGLLRHPTSGNLIQKGTQVLTTSTIMAHYLGSFRCSHDHQHSQVAGSFKDKQGRHKPLSEYTELYTANFGRKLARAMQASKHTQEPSVASASVVCHSRTIDDVDEPSDENEPKRRRVTGKRFPPPGFPVVPPTATESDSSEQPGHDVSSSLDLIFPEILKKALQVAPRVGRLILESGELFQEIERACPEHRIRVVEICKGTDRFRKPPIKLAVGEAPLRCMFGVHRHSLEPTEFWPWTNWEKMSNRQLNKSSPPHRLLVTVFARHEHAKRERDDEETAENSKRAKMTEADVPYAPTTDETTPQNTEQIPTTTHQPEQEAAPTPKITDSIHTHGPKYRALDKPTQQWISKIHHNLGHPNKQKLQAVLKLQGYSAEIIDSLHDFVCPTCHELQLPKIARPANLTSVREFNDVVGCDLITWTNKKGRNFQFLHFIDAATNFQLAVPVFRTDAESLFQAFLDCWCHWAGPCKQLIIDNASALCSDQFAVLTQSKDIHLRVVAAYAHWQMGKTERHGDILQHMLQKFDHEHEIDHDEIFHKALYQCCNAKNSLSRVKGYTPEILVLGKSAKLPGSLSDEEFVSPAQFLADGDTPEGIQFRQNLNFRECARKAFISADHNEQLRRAFLRRQRPSRGSYLGGSFVMFWRPGRGELPGQWHGPAKVIIQESQNVVWISHSSRVYRVAPEHVRLLSEKEAAENSVVLRESTPMSMPRETGRGVFQYEDLTDQVVRTPEMMPHPPQAPPSTTSQEEQPDAEPPYIPETPPSISYSPTTPAGSNAPSDQEPNSEDNTHHAEEPKPEDVPIPDSEDDELTVEDFWIHQGNQLMRIHRKPRTEAFEPSSVPDCPVDILLVCGERSTTGNFGDGPIWGKQDEWGRDQDHWIAPKPWTGVTMFSVLHQDANVVNMVQEEDIMHVEEHQCLEYEIFFTQDDIDAVQQTPTEFLTLAATAAKRQRSEVKIKDLSNQERKEFDVAKGKEIDQWLATETVRKILRHKIPEKNILRCRWVLTWKDLDAVDAAKEGKSRKAKARLVILGYEDPDLCDIPRDSPTLQKESRSLILQLCAARHHKIRSFDIKTAFLRGSRRDNRLLGVDPPPELRDKLNLRDDEICELLKSAYGLVNAPFLWYQELRESLLNLGFRISPLDPCLFVLTNEQGYVHGVIGMHVDDGLCFGDAVFNKALDVLEQKFPFGSKREGEFTFTGLHLKQDEYFNIHIDQTEYVQGIEPIQIDRTRRKDESLAIKEDEKQQLRAVIGSLQYAATNSRPDVSARLSFLQSKINSATIGDLLEANRLLGDTKRHAHSGITISAMDEDAIRIVSYSDASFASRAKQQSQKGGLFLAVHSDIFLQKSAIASPITWYSKKIDRVVASTLAAETYALSSAVDMTDWLRLMWAWIRNPNIPWQKPEEVWRQEPPSIAVVDCKSLYDVITKNTTPQCQEHRTLVEALVIKHHVQHGIKPHWVHSAAQLADCLTKTMDCFRLREFLSHRTCCLHDVEEILKQRADRKAQKTWLSNNADKHQTIDLGQSLGGK